MSSKPSRHVLGWIFGVVIGFAGLITLFSQVFLGLVLLVMALVLLPPANSFFQRKYNFVFTRKIKILSLIGLVILAGVVSASDSPSTTSKKPEASKQNEVVVTNTPTQTPVSLEDQIKQVITQRIGAKDSDGKPVLISVTIEKYKPVELQAYHYKSTDNIVGVFVKINGRENLSANLTKGSIDDQASNIFQGVFPLADNIGDVQIWSYLPTKDKYGNVKDDVAITFSMSRPLFEKINWTNLNHRELPDLLSTEFRTDDRNNYVELIRF